MTADITIEEIVRLDSERTSGVWNPLYNGAPGDFNYIMAAPRIAAKAIVLDKVNKELVTALGKIENIRNITNVDNGEAMVAAVIKIASRALTKAGEI